MARARCCATRTKNCSDEVECPWRLKSGFPFSLTMLLLVTPLPLSSSIVLLCVCLCECVLCGVVARSPVFRCRCFPTALCCWTDPCSIKLKTTASLSLSHSLSLSLSLSFSLSALSLSLYSSLSHLSLSHVSSLSLLHSLRLSPRHPSLSSSLILLSSHTHHTHTHTHTHTYRKHLAHLSHTCLLVAELNYIRIYSIVLFSVLLCSSVCFGFSSMKVDIYCTILCCNLLHYVNNILYYTTSYYSNILLTFILLDLFSYVTFC